MTDRDEVLDSRFETELEDVEHLLSVVDIDELDDLATMLMVLLVRPVMAEEVWDPESEASCLEIILSGDDHAIGTTHSFPISVLELVRGSAETARDLGPYDASTAQDPVPDLSTLDRRELISRLQQALGQVRLLAMFYDE